MKAVLFKDGTNAQHIAQQPCCPASNPSTLPFHAGVCAAHGRRHSRQRRADQKLIYFLLCIVISTVTE
jgi:hypothetical protein